MSAKRTMNMYHGRIVVNISDCYGATTFHHGMVVAPKSIETSKQALQAVTDAYNAAKKDNPDGWTYENIVEILATNGFDYVLPLYWEEPPNAVQGD